MPRFTTRHVYHFQPGRSNFPGAHGFHGRHGHHGHHVNLSEMMGMFGHGFRHTNYYDMVRRPHGMFEYGHLSNRDRYTEVPEPTKPDTQPDKTPTQVVPKPEEIKEILQVEKVDYKIAENVAAHHTADYDITDPEETAILQLVVRRGQPFDIEIQFNRPYNQAKDDLRLVFQVGDKPLASKKTHVEFILSHEDLPKQWGAKINKQDGNVLVVTIFTPPDCFVAKWNFKVDVVKKTEESKSIFRYNHEYPIYMLFNPWCKDDTVYLEGDDNLKEYVLNETGILYQGTDRKIREKAWNFGQFQGDILECCMYLLDTAGINWAVRGNPIPISRKISALVNNTGMDDTGILIGNWSGNYSGGKSPLSWTGSQAILEQYFRTKEPVEYGQCWVFSGVTTTVCRALGIPARSVTNFASAHDTDGSITIDIHFSNVTGEPMDEKNGDSIWNFHVWNEVYMARPDLPAGYGGWQAIDATPQEASEGVFCCGPVPVQAIKKGEVNIPFDAPFVFAEVNSDRIYWMVEADESMENVQVVKDSVGKNISTKAANSTEREDVTKHYKFSEGSQEERVAVLRANQAASTRPGAYKRGKEDVSFSVTIDDDTFIGEDINIVMTMKNNGTSERLLNGCRLTAKTVYYTGVVGELCKSEPFDECLAAGETKTHTLTLKCEDYFEHLKDSCMLKISAMGKVQETKQVYAYQHDFRLRKPHLSIKAPKSAKVGEKITVEVSFTNPLPETLTNCTLDVEGAGLGKPKEIQEGNVEKKQTFVSTFDLIPKKAGKRELIVSFNSKQILDINGSCSLTIVKG